MRRRIGILYLASFLGCCVPYVSSAQERAELHQFPVPLALHRRAPESTPPGVTVIDVFGFDGRFLWRYVATNHGKPLYTVDVGIDPAQVTCELDAGHVTLRLPLVNPSQGLAPMHLAG